MSRKHKFVTAVSDSKPATAPCPTNWQLCSICQPCNKNPLISPARGRGKMSSYEHIAKNLIQFQNIQIDPFSINPARLDEGKGIIHTLKSRNALYHKSCYLCYSNYKHKVAKKNVKSFDFSPKTTRIRLDTSVEESQRSSCFFCEESDGQMRQARTDQIGERVRRCPTTLCDSKLLTKLALCDMRTLKALYITTNGWWVFTTVIER